MKIEIDGEMIYDKVTGKTICNIEEIENMEQAKEIIGILIEEIEKLLTEKEDYEIEKEYLEDKIGELKDGNKILIEYIRSV